MSGVEIGHLIYLVLLLLMVVGWFFMSNRPARNQLAQQAAIWGLIFVGTISAVGLWGDLRQQVLPMQRVAEGGEIVLPRAPDGHYYATLALNGAPVRFVVDTGASQMVLSLEDAAAAGIAQDELRFVNEAETANGTVRTAAVRLDEVRFGETVERGVRAMVNAAAMPHSLLGMDYLNRFARIEISGGKLILHR